MTGTEKNLNHHSLQKKYNVNQLNYGYPNIRQANQIIVNI